MNCEELNEYYELYAMGAAGEPEKSEIREHLNRGCEDCMAGMKRARSIVSFLGGTAPPMVPSPMLRRRILASVGFEQRRFSWMPLMAFATAMSIFAAVYFSTRERDVALIATNLREQLGKQNVELTRLSEAFSILNGPDTKSVSFGTGSNASSKGRVFMNPSQGVLLIASNLQPAPKGKKYEMWVVPKGGGKPVPAGLFQSDQDGTAMHIQRGSIDLNATAAVAVTVEDAAGAQEPTMPLVIAAPLQ
ncbi:MAG TPA: anti-sigma factor [Bryobacteraceae bacterium]|nr:anti-sigma factor [Bryobacteraceae bacterium]